MTNATQAVIIATVDQSGRSVTVAVAKAAIQINQNLIIFKKKTMQKVNDEHMHITDTSELLGNENNSHPDCLKLKAEQFTVDVWFDHATGSEAGGGYSVEIPDKGTDFASGDGFMVWFDKNDELWVYFCPPYHYYSTRDGDFCLDEDESWKLCDKILQEIRAQYCWLAEASHWFCGRINHSLD